jgi:hypothetical protein
MLAVGRGVVECVELELFRSHKPTMLGAQHRNYRSPSPARTGIASGSLITVLPAPEAAME